METVDSSLSAYVSETFDLQGISNVSFEQMRQLLIERVDELFRYDFEKLKWILYRIDVNEHKLSFILKQNTDKEVAEIIADAIIQRQIEKINTRKQYSGEGGGDWDFEV